MLQLDTGYESHLFQYLHTLDCSCRESLGDNQVWMQECQRAKRVGGMS